MNDKPNTSSSFPVTTRPSSRYVVNSIDTSNEQLNGIETSALTGLGARGGLTCPSGTNAGSCFQDSFTEVFGATSFIDNFLDMIRRQDLQGAILVLFPISIDSTVTKDFFF